MPHSHRNHRRKPKQSFKKRVLTVMKANAELKENFGTGTDTSLIAGSGFADDLINNIAQGDGNGQRIGDHIEVKDLSIKASVFSGTASGLVRCYVYQGLEDNPPDTTAMTLAPNDFFPSLQDTNSKYKVLYNKVISLDPDYRSSFLFNIRIPAKKLGLQRIEFDAAAETIVGGGLVKMRIETDNTTASQMTVDSNYRLRYVDL